MECKKCKRNWRRNYYNNHSFSMDLYGGEPPYPHSHLDIEVVSFFDSTEEGVCEPTFDLYLDKGIGKDDGMGDGERVLCEDVPLSQLERLYHFLDLVINKSHKIKGRR